MSEDVDPFEVAMAALDDVQDEPEKNEVASSDPFEAAISAIDETSALSDTMDSNVDNADPVDSALQIAKAGQGALPAPTTGTQKAVNVNFLMDIKLTITFEVGRAKMFISDLLSLGQGSVIELHRLVGEELEIFVNGQMFATGEVVVVNEKFGARITKILSPEERILRLGPES